MEIEDKLALRKGIDVIVGMQKLPYWRFQHLLDSWKAEIDEENKRITKQREEQERQSKSQNAKMPNYGNIKFPKSPKW